jgi:type II secretory pathway predicted ATPase ExeA
MLEYILEDFGVSKPGDSRAQRLFALNRFLIERRRASESAVLILDEAHNLDVPTLEQIRLLSNFETANEKLLQIVLVGQPELREKLKRREMRQLYQRIGLRAHIQPLSEGDVREYINTRLRVAGGPGVQMFTKQAVRRIAEYSQGVPRVVNILCDHCLVIGYADEASTITRSIVEQGIDALESGERRTRWPVSAAMKWVVGGAATAAVAGLAAPHIGNGDLGRLSSWIVDYLNGIVGAARDFFLQ